MYLLTWPTRVGYRRDALYVYINEIFTRLGDYSTRTRLRASEKNKEKEKRNHREKNCETAAAATVVKLFLIYDY